VELATLTFSVQLLNLDLNKQFRIRTYYNNRCTYVCVNVVYIYIWSASALTHTHIHKGTNTNTLKRMFHRDL